MVNNNTHIICKSIFKSGDSKPIVNQFTQKWIELINQSEINKKASKVRS
jgi:hypothetical protein